MATVEEENRTIAVLELFKKKRGDGEIVFDWNGHYRSRHTAIPFPDDYAHMYGYHAETRLIASLELEIMIQWRRQTDLDMNSDLLEVINTMMQKKA